VVPGVVDRVINVDLPLAGALDLLADCAAFRVTAISISASRYPGIRRASCPQTSFRPLSASRIETKIRRKIDFSMFVVDFDQNFNGRR
jgi:hypothetical protein